jgi:hypothetical protein
MHDWVSAARDPSGTVPSYEPPRFSRFLLNCIVSCVRRGVCMRTRSDAPLAATEEPLTGDIPKYRFTSSGAQEGGLVWRAVRAADHRCGRPGRSAGSRPHPNRCLSLRRRGALDSKIHPLSGQHTIRIRRLVLILREMGVGKPEPPPLVTSVQQCVAQYRRYLVHQRGLAESAACGLNPKLKLAAGARSAKREKDYREQSGREQVSGWRLQPSSARI